MILEAAAVFGCLVLDSPAAVDGWLRRLGMAPAAQAHSRRFKRRATWWRGGDRWAIVLPDAGLACVIDMGRDWRRLGGGPSPDPSADLPSPAEAGFAKAGGSGPQAEGSGPQGEPARLRQPVARSLGEGGGFGGHAY